MNPCDSFKKSPGLKSSGLLFCGGGGGGLFLVGVVSFLKKVWHFLGK